MTANETKIEEFLSSNKTHFVIPVYQRNYDWTTAQCKQLLEDILEVGNNEKKTSHFIGSIVYIHDGIYTSARIKELTIIDGQQRITTITLIYLALYQLAKKLEDASLENEIYETYLINKFVSDSEKIKLRPTSNNEEALKYLLRNHQDEEFNGFARFIDNYNYFKKKIIEENFEVVQKGLSKLMFVEVSLERGNDDPQRIFESLNSTGLELTQADLIRNYILMDLEPKYQNMIYEDYWKVIEQYANDDASNKSLVSDFIRDYLTVENNKIPNKSNVYNEFKEKYPKSEVDELKIVLNKIISLARHYKKLINPKNESDSEIRKQLEYINRLEINVAYPFLIRVYEDYINQVIDKQVFVKILELIQTYTWRRFIVGLPTNSLNKIFINLYSKVDKDNYLFSIQKSLLQRIGVQRFPRNEELISSLESRDIYNINPKNKHYLLERLENYQNNEVVKIEGNPTITIEHIFPQNPDPNWELELGTDEFNFIKSNYLNTIGNLTLSGNNGALGNKTFLEKQKMNIDGKEQGYFYSRLWLNRDLKTLQLWNKTTIEERTKKIIERFLKIWEIPNIKLDDVVLKEEVNIFDAGDPKGKKLDYALFLDQKLEIRQISKLYQIVISQLFDSEPQRFFTSDLAEKLSLTKFPNEANLLSPMAINDTYYIESNLDSKGKFERIKQVLTTFGLEDDLLIKYAD